MNKKIYFLLCVLILSLFLSAGVVCANDNVNTTNDDVLNTAVVDGGVSEELGVVENVTEVEDTTSDVVDSAVESTNDINENDVYFLKVSNDDNYDEQSNDKENEIIEVADIDNLLSMVFDDNVLGDDARSVSGTVTSFSATRSVYNAGSGGTWQVRVVRNSGPSEVPDFYGSRWVSGGSTTTMSASTSGVFKAGTYRFTIYVNYGSGWTAGVSASCTVSKVNPTSITASSSDYTYGSGGSILYSGTVKGKRSNVPLTGNVSIYRDGVFIKKVVCDEDGRFYYSWNSTDLKPSSYTFSCYYVGNEYYNAVGSGTNLQAPVTVNVAKLNFPSLSGAFSNDYVYGTSGNQVIYSGKFHQVNSGNLTGTAAIYCDGVQIDSVDVDSEGNFYYNVSSTKFLPDKTYRFSVMYLGGDYYNPASANVGFKDVHIYKPSIVNVTVYSRNIEYGDNGNQIIYWGNFQKFNDVDVNGTATVYCNGVSVGTVDVSADGEWSYNVSSTDLDVGSYDFTIVYNSNSIYNSYGQKDSTGLRTLVVDKGTPIITPLSPVILNEVYPGKVNVTFIVKNKNGDLLNGIVLNPAGNKFNSASKSSSNGVVTFIVTPVDAGVYTDWGVSSSENKNYYSATSDSVEEFIIKYNVTVNIDKTLTPSTSFYERSVALTGSINYPAGDRVPSGRVWVRLGDKLESVLVDSEGKFSMIFTGGVPGYYYEVNDVYFEPVSGENIYVSSENATVNINRIIINRGIPQVINLLVSEGMHVYGGDITVSGKVVGIGTVPPTGDVLIYIDDDYTKLYGSYSLVSGDDGEFSVTIGNAPSGDHHFTAVYSGDTYWDESTNNSEIFHVDPAEISFDSVVATSGNYSGKKPSAFVNVSVHGNGGGETPRGIIRVSLEDGSRSWTGTLVDGKAVVYINDLSVGTYSNVKVEYEHSVDDNNYNNKVYPQVTGFTINKGVPDFVIEAPAVEWGEDADITIVLPNDATGVVIITIKGNTTVITDLSLANRVITLSNPDAGSYKITATYSGDSNWLGYDDGYGEYNTTLFVERPCAVLNISADNVDYGMDAVINFEVYYKGVLQDKARGTVIVYGLGEKDGYEVAISNGRGTLTVSDLNMGSYNIVAYYGGYNDLAGCINVSSFDVLGVDTNMALNLNASSVNINSTVLLTVNVNSDISDPIYLYIDGEKYDVVVANNGLAKFVISNLPVGVHNITTVMQANNKYNAVSNNTTLAVNKVDPNYVVDVVVDSSRNIIFTITVDDATGSIRIEGNGTNKRILFDHEIVEYSILNAPIGVYTFNITYGGDDNYNGFTTNVTVDAAKISDYSMSINNTVAVLGKKVTVYVNAPELEGKKIRLYINGAG